MSTVVFLGGGRITSAMLAGLRLAKTRHRLVVHDRNPGKLRDLKNRYAVAVEPDLNRAVQQADVLIVAVRPNSVRDLFRAIGESEQAVACGQSWPQVCRCAHFARRPARPCDGPVPCPVRYAAAGEA